MTVLEDRIEMADQDDELTLDDLFESLERTTPEGYKVEIVEGAIFMSPQRDTHWEIIADIYEQLRTKYPRQRVKSDVRVDYPGHLNGFASDVTLVAEDAAKSSRGCGATRTSSSSPRSSPRGRDPTTTAPRRPRTPRQKSPSTSSPTPTRASATSTPSPRATSTPPRRPSPSARTWISPTPTSASPSRPTSSPATDFTPPRRPPLPRAHSTSLACSHEVHAARTHGTQGQPARPRHHELRSADRRGRQPRDHGRGAGRGY